MNASNILAAVDLGATSGRVLTGQLDDGVLRLASCRNWLLIPDLLNFWLTGNAATELTNASTTGLIDPETRTWSKQLFSALGEVAVTDVASKTAELVTAGDVVGELNPSIMNLQDAAGNLAEVISVASHDTASAVAATPLTSRNSAYISCGTWSLVGVELKRPVVTEAARAANFTNELGVDGAVRFLKNVSGMWIVNECIRNWRASGTSIDAETICFAC